MQVLRGPTLTARCPLLARLRLHTVWAERNDRHQYERELYCVGGLRVRSSEIPPNPPLEIPVGGGFVDQFDLLCVMIVHAPAAAPMGFALQKRYLRGQRAGRSNSHAALARFTAPGSHTLTEYTV